MPLLPTPPELIKIAKAIAKYKGRSILVGGAVRDHCMGRRISKDLDVEIFGMSPEALESVLQQFGVLHTVGKSFGVLKLKTSNAEYDFSLPRSESKTGKGHRGFLVTPDSTMSYQKAASRRDFTINSIGYDLLNQEFLDPFDGLRDLKRKVLRHIGPSFSEDPLRVLRAMQFSARLEFEIAPETVKLCRQLNLSELSRERIFEEFRKLLLKAKRPSIGLDAAEKLGLLAYFPELKALIGVPQDPEWHPEGDVWIHTLLVLDEAAGLRKGDDKKDLELMFGALCHDFGKPLTTIFLRGRWRSPAHDVEGVALTEQFLRRLTDDRNLIEQVKTLVKEHLRPIQLFKDRERINSGTIRRLALRVRIPELVLLARADYFGRTLTQEERKCFEAGDWLLDEAERMDVYDEAPRPLLMGRHLLALGMSPGPEIGIILKQAFERQLNGDFLGEDDAISWAESNLLN
jgi:tRNA nucleotidyltransferase (CCA-adding enzyme)